MKIEGEAAQLRTTAEALGKLLEQKCLAYGGAHNRQVDIWRAMLAQYEEERNGVAGYWIPAALIYHMPRLTRVFDRAMRIVANPANDHGGEDPWRDMAGDALAGCVMPKPSSDGKCYDVECERKAGHEGTHAKWDASGVTRWHEDPVIHALQGMAMPRGYDPGMDP